MPTGDTLDTVLRILGFVAPPVGGLAVWAIAKYVKLLHVEKEAETLRKDKEQAGQQIAALQDERLRLRAAYNEARDKFYRIRRAYVAFRDAPVAPPVEPVDTTAREEELRRAIADARAAQDQQHAQTRELEASRELISQLQTQIGTLESSVDQFQREAERLEAQIAEMTRFDGRLWLRDVPDSAPAFRPREDRRCTIVSVLNLKGGVGKTTIAANLAATWAKANGKALMVDLDYQRSLSMLLVADDVRKLLHKSGDSVQHFLANPDHAAGELLRRCHGLDPDLPHCAVLTNSDSPTGSDSADSLEETENRLMAEWLFDRTRPDPRFLLRHALHDPAVAREYRYVILDCPPRLTTACVNALAASDFVLIPVVPDAVSTRAVENLLRTLKQFRESVLPELAVLGIVPNMVRLRSDQPIQAHAKALGELKALLPILWDESIPIARSMVKHDTEFGQAAAEMDVTGKPRLAVANKDIDETFRALARELEKEIDRHASGHAATVPPKSRSRARRGG